MECKLIREMIGKDNYMIILMEEQYAFILQTNGFYKIISRKCNTNLKCFISLIVIANSL